MSDKSIHSRIKKILETTNLNYSSFGKKLEISDVVIGNVIKGRNKPSYDLLLNIIQTFDWINPEWLITGKGEMLKNTDNTSNQNNDNCEKTIARMEKQLDRQEREIIRLTKFIDSLQREQFKHKSRSD